MSNQLWLTPEEVMRKKKRNKTLLYAAIMIGTVVLSTIVTLLANHL
jgi:hypothetical protein